MIKKGMGKFSGTGVALVKNGILSGSSVHPDSLTQKGQMTVSRIW